MGSQPLFRRGLTIMSLKTFESWSHMSASKEERESGGEIGAGEKKSRMLKGGKENITK